jgi:hypothetical protein
MHISSVLLVVRPITQACPECWLTYNSIAFSSSFSNCLRSLFPLNFPLCTQLWKERYWIPLSRHIVHNHFLFQDTPSIIGHTMCCFKPLHSYNNQRLTENFLWLIKSSKACWQATQVRTIYKIESGRNTISLGVIALLTDVPWRN